LKYFQNWRFAFARTLHDFAEPLYDFAIADALIFAIKRIVTMNLSWNEFERVDIRLGTIVDACDFPQAKKPAYQLTIDFGAGIGMRKSSAQITKRYSRESLIGRQVVAVINFPPKQIANFMSECLVLGAVEDGGGIVLLAPDFKVENGSRIG
jgi:tRNA-binding protein